MSDAKYKQLLREYIAEPTPAGLSRLAGVMVQMGLLEPLPTKHREGNSIKLAAATHVAAIRLARGESDFLSHIPQFTLARRRTQRRLLFAKIIRGGVSFDDLRAVWFAANTGPLARALWSPSGESFDEILRPLDYSYRGTAQVQLYLGCENPDGRLSAILLDHFCVVSDTETSQYNVTTYRGFDEDFLASFEDAYEQISSQAGVSEPEIRKAMTSFSGIAQVFFEFVISHGREELIVDEFLDTSKDFKAAFAPEIAMYDRRWLGR
jgi:hypothetical protein